jgi:hypothetical protein
MKRVVRWVRLGQKDFQLGREARGGEMVVKKSLKLCAGSVVKANAHAFPLRWTLQVESVR